MTQASYQSMTGLPRTFAALAIIVFAASACSGQDWRDQVFSEREHDFGTVAVGAETVHHFTVRNTLSNRIRFQSIRASCGCTTPTILNSIVQPGGEGQIRAKFNTDTFKGKKGATVTVVMVEPFYSEIQLKVKGYIRSDIVFHPSKVDFGKVSQGTPGQSSTTIYYAGRDDWQIVNVRSNQPWITPRFHEVSRGGGSVQYALSVQLSPDAPAGFFQDELVVETNDNKLSQVPLKVTGDVSSPLSISPQAVALGSLKPAEPIQTKLIVVGKTPFRIGSLKADGWQVDYTPTDQAKKVHIIRPTLSYIGDTPGPQKVPLVITAEDGETLSAQTLLTANVRGS